MPLVYCETPLRVPLIWHSLRDRAGRRGRSEPTRGGPTPNDDKPIKPLDEEFVSPLSLGWLGISRSGGLARSSDLVSNPVSGLQLPLAQASTHLINGLCLSLLGSLPPDFFLWMRFATITLADVLRVAIVVTVQSIHYKAVRPYPAHLFIDVLAKVGYVKNATSIVQVGIHQVVPKAFKQG